jgi:Tfp pilus assembly protein PilO
MGLSQRERIVLTTIIVVGALVADKLLLTPLSNAWGEIKGGRQQSATQVAQARTLLTQTQQKEQKYKAALDNLGTEAEAESRVAKALDRWSEDAGLTVTSVKPDRAAGDKGLKEIVFVVAGKGSLEGVAQFLYQVETSDLAVKIKHMQLGSTSESGQAMSMELRLSTLYVAAAGEKSSSKQRQPKKQGTTDEEQL